jgi:uncharacterized protein YdcH (DUF465 family)
LDTLSELKINILKSSNINELNSLISLRAFLIDQEQTPWAIIDVNEELADTIMKFENNSNSYYKNKNISNIKKFNVSLLEIYLLPKNKRLILIEMLDDIIQNLLNNKILIKDPLRVNPFSDDELFEYLKINKIFVDNITFNKYQKRSQDLNRLIMVAELENTIYSNNISTTKKNKIIEYWRNIWGDNKFYHSNVENIIDHVII